MTVSTLPRAKTFYDDVAALISRTDPADLAEQVAELHDGCMEPLRAKVRTLESENGQIHADMRRSHYITGQVERLAMHNIQTNASQAATVAAQSSMLREVRKLAQSSFDGNVSAEKLAALLVTEAAPPEIYGVNLAFIASEQYRGGTFVSDDRGVVVTYPFIGWTVVARHVGGGVTVEPTFLVGDRGAMPVSQVEAEKQVHLEYPMLPQLRQL